MINSLAETEAFRQKAQALCEIGKICYERGWSPATSSNYSIRLDDEHCALTSSGKHKGQLTPADILVVNWAGEAVTAGKPSAETLLHTQLYARDQNIGAVLHTHAPAAVLVSQLTTETHLTLAGWELLKALPNINTHDVELRIPVFDNTQDIATLATQVDALMETQSFPAYLIRGHGIYTWGETLDDCFRHLEAMDCLLNYDLELRKLK